MVGTIEPRKGYAPTLDAFEVAWQEDCQVQLVIVGRPGWKARRLIARLRAHPESGRRLHWFDDADDATLLSLYDAASGVLVASEAEGFGLPILEAALHQKPLLVRDIPVFREIAAEGAAYFSENTSTQFAKDIKRWIRDVENGTAPKSSTIPLRTWTQSANEAMAILTAVNSSATTGIESPVSMVHTVNMS